MPASSAQPQRDPPSAASLDPARARVMAVSLTALLDRVRGSRDALQHLAALETALQQQGLKSLDRVSMTALARICSQLASMPVAENDAPLQDLQTHLLSVMERRSRPQVTQSALATPAPASALPVRLPPAPAAGGTFTGAVTVSELSHSAFMRALHERDGTGPVPPHSDFGLQLHPT